MPCPSPYHPRPGAGRARRSRRPRRRRRGHGRLRRDHPPRRRRRRRTRREGPGRRRAANSRGTLNVLEAARATGAARRLRLDDLGLLRRRRDRGRRGHARSRCPSHLYTATKLAGEMYCHSYGELYDVESTILRFGIPYGPRARPGRGAADLRQQGARGRAADDRRRRLADAPLRLRRGPRRRRRARARAGGRRAIYNLVGERGHDDPRDRRGRPRRDRRRRDRPTPQGRAGDFAGAPRERRARGAGARLDARRRRSRRACARYVAWHREDAARAAPRRRPSAGRRRGRARAPRRAIAVAWRASPPRVLVARASPTLSAGSTPTSTATTPSLDALRRCTCSPLVLAGGVRAAVARRRARPARRAVDRSAACRRGRRCIPARTARDRPRATGHAIVLARCFALVAALAARLVRSAPGGRCERARVAEQGRPLTLRAVAGRSSRFAIGFDERDRARLHELWDGVIDSQRWSEGPLTERFEAAWEAHNALPAVALVELDRRRAGRARVAGVRGATVVVPVEHVHGDAARRARARAPTPVFGDCRRDDLCLSLRGLRAPDRRSTIRRRSSSSTSAATSRSTSEQIAELCRRARRPPDRGLRARARRELERQPPGLLRRRRHLLVVRDEDDLHRRGRRARLAPPRADRVRPRVSQLRQARPRRSRA